MGWAALMMNLSGSEVHILRTYSYGVRQLRVLSLRPKLSAVMTWRDRRTVDYAPEQWLHQPVAGVTPSCVVAQLMSQRQSLYPAPLVPLPHGVIGTTYGLGHTSSHSPPSLTPTPRPAFQHFSAPSKTASAAFAYSRWSCDTHRAIKTVIGLSHGPHSFKDAPFTDSAQAVPQPTQPCTPAQASFSKALTAALSAARAIRSGCRRTA